MSPGLVKEPETEDAADGGNPVLPGDFLPRFIVTAMIGDRYLVDAATELGHLGCELRLESEPVRTEAQPPQQIRPKDLVAGLHVGEVQVGEHVGQCREETIADVV